MSPRFALAVVASVAVAVAACGQPSPSVLATQHFGDPSGDATADLLGITTFATADSVVIEFEFATNAIRDESAVRVDITEPEPEPTCGGYTSQYFVWVPPLTPIPSGEAHDADLIGSRGELIAWLDVARDGPRVSVKVPLASIGDPPWLFFHALTWVEASPDSNATRDNSPDIGGACHAAPLESAQSNAPVLATDRFSDPTGDAAVADIVAISTAATADAVALEIEFADEVISTVTDQWLVILITTDEWAEEGGCSGYTGPYFVTVPPLTPVPSGEVHEAELAMSIQGVSGRAQHLAWLEEVWDGRRASVELPLALIGGPNTLYFSVNSADDRSPDTDLRCHAAVLGP